MPCFHPDLDKKNDPYLKCKRCKMTLPAMGDSFAVCLDSGFTLPCVSPCGQTSQKHKKEV